MKHCSLNIFFFIAIVLSACSQSAEDYGRTMAEKECECDLLRTQFDTKRAQQTIEDIKAKKFKIASEALSMRRHGSYGGKFTSDSTAVALCARDLKNMEEQASVLFVSQDVRLVLQNSYQAHLEMGRKSLRESRKINERAQEEVRLLVSTLPLR